uniref:DNA replication factor RFC1 C-terminal domain-containing protein n=1 Tax=Romanomermis culicivorax TaxID=13658 RepID=A0A915L5Y6_ROMCU
KVNKKLDAISSAASYLAIGDIIEKQIRTDGNWSLLNDQAIFSVVAPAEKVKGYLKGAAQFPQWFGKNSKQNKFSRMLGQIQMHTCLKISCNTKSFNLDYAPVFREKLLKPLLKSEKDGPRTSFNVLQYYDLTKEDMDDILELTQYPDTKDSFSKVSTKKTSAI